MRFILSICLGIVLMSFNANGQIKIQNNDNSLLVKGVAIIKETPEIIYATINIKIESEEYRDCHNKVMIALQKAKLNFLNSGINKDLIKTNGIGVAEKIDYTRMGKVRTGFIGQVSFKVESIYTVEFTQKLLQAIKSDSLAVNNSIGFKLSESQKTKLRQKAIKMAIDDAKEKAESIAESSNVELRKINSIVYMDDNFFRRGIDQDIIKEEVRNLQGVMIGGLGKRSPTIDFNPKEISIQKSVQIEWKIREKK